MWTFRLKKTCRDLRYFVDQERPSANINSIQITHAENIIELRLNTGEDSVTLEYRNTENGYTLRAEFNGTDNTRVVEGTNYIDAMCHEFGMLMKHQKSVMEKVCFVIHDDDSEVLWQKIRETVEKGKLFRAKAVSMATPNLPIVLSFLPCFEPKTLQSIRILGSLGVDITVVADSIQWKSAKSGSVFGYTIQNAVKNFLHFNIFTGYTDGLTKDDLVQIKDTLLRSPDFLSGLLSFTPLLYQKELFSLLGPHCFLQEGKRTWYFESPVTGKEIMKFEFQAMNILDIEKINVTDVPESAVII